MYDMSYIIRRIIILVKMVCVCGTRYCGMWCIVNLSIYFCNMAGYVLTSSLSYKYIRVTPRAR